MLPRARLKQHGGSAVRRAPAARTQARLLADLLADLVLLLVERLLLGLGDVAAVGARHGALFLADGAVLSVQLGRLRLGELAFLALLVDALVLVGEPIVNLLAARVGLLPTRTRDRKSTRQNSSHEWISYAVFCLKKKKNTLTTRSG